MSVLFTMLLLALALVLCVAAVLHGLATMLLRPPRMTDGKALYVLRRMSPSDLGLSFETLRFGVPRSERAAAIDIAAWWIAAERASEKTAILIHGYGDAKVGALAWAPLWRSLGFNCLLIDLRAHGESGGTHTTGGVIERDDLEVILNRLRIDKPSETKQIVLFGVSLGGAVALACAARREDVAAVVCDSTFADYASAAAAHGELIGAPLPRLLPWAIRWAERRAGVRFADARPLDTLPACRCPVMLIHGDADPFVPEADVLALGKALINRGNDGDVHWIAEDAPHVLALAQQTATYEMRVGSFVAGLNESKSCD